MTVSPGGLARGISAFVGTRANGSPAAALNMPRFLKLPEGYTSHMVENRMNFLQKYEKICYLLLDNGKLPCYNKRK